jgi:hypothetical protein
LERVMVTRRAGSSADALSKKTATSHSVFPAHSQPYSVGTLIQEVTITRAGSTENLEQALRAS